MKNQRNYSQLKKKKKDPAVQRGDNKLLKELRKIVHRNANHCKMELKL